MVWATFGQHFFPLFQKTAGWPAGFHWTKSRHSTGLNRHTTETTDLASLGQAGKRLVNIGFTELDHKIRLGKGSPSTLPVYS